MNIEQVKSFIRWATATIGPFLISTGYISASGLQMASGILLSLVPLVWSMITHTQENAVKIVDAIAKDPESGVKAVVTEPNVAGRALAEAIPGTTTVVAGTAAATAAAES